MYCDVVNVQPRFNFSDVIINNLVLVADAGGMAPESEACSVVNK